MLGAVLFTLQATVHAEQSRAKCKIESLTPLRPLRAPPLAPGRPPPWPTYGQPAARQAHISLATLTHVSFILLSPLSRHMHAPCASKFVSTYSEESQFPHQNFF